MDVEDREKTLRDGLEPRLFNALVANVVVGSLDVTPAGSVSVLVVAVVDNEDTTFDGRRGVLVVVGNGDVSITVIFVCTVGAVVNGLVVVVSKSVLGEFAVIVGIFTV